MKKAIAVSSNETRADGAISIGKGRPSGRVVKGNNAGVNVGNAGNGHSNAAMGGFPHRSTGSRAGRDNITREP